MMSAGHVDGSLDIGVSRKTAVHRSLNGFDLARIKAENRWSKGFNPVLHPRPMCEQVGMTPEGCFSSVLNPPIRL